MELEGANVSLLMPPPFCQRHDSYMARYAAEGVPHILDTMREVVGLHKVGAVGVRGPRCGVRGRGSLVGGPWLGVEECVSSLWGRKKPSTRWVEQERAVAPHARLPHLGYYLSGPSIPAPGQHHARSDTKQNHNYAYPMSVLMASRHYHPSLAPILIHVSSPTVQERYVFPLSICVIKLNGTGSDRWAQGGHGVVVAGGKF